MFAPQYEPLFTKLREGLKINLHISLSGVTRLLVLGLWERREAELSFEPVFLFGEHPSQYFAFTARQLFLRPI